MKAERRHELKENTLVRKLEEIPSFSKTYGTRLLLGVIVLAIIAMLIRYRLNSAAESLAQAQQTLSLAREDLKDLRTLTYAPPAQAVPVAARRQELYDDGLQQVDATLKKASDKQADIRAQALVTQGDLNWELANMPDLPGAATQPALMPNQSTADLLSSAETAYQAVVSQYPKQTTENTAAHFGLAAIAENRAVSDHSQWEKARSEYQAILDSDAPQPYKDVAQVRMNNLNQLEQPALFGVPSIASTLPSVEIPTTLPIIGPTIPKNLPTTLPATLP